MTNFEIISKNKNLKDILNICYSYDYLINNHKKNKKLKLYYSNNNNFKKIERKNKNKNKSKKLKNLYNSKYNYLEVYKFTPLAFRIYDDIIYQLYMIDYSNDIILNIISYLCPHIIHKNGYNYCKEHLEKNLNGFYTFLAWSYMSYYYKCRDLFYKKYVDSNCVVCGNYECTCTHKRNFFIQNLYNHNFDIFHIFNVLDYQEPIFISYSDDDYYNLREYYYNSDDDYKHDEECRFYPLDH